MPRILTVVGLVIAIAAGILGLNLLVFIETPYGRAPQQITIEKGTSVAGVARRLEQNGILSNALLFKSYVLLKGAAGKIRAGEYSFPEGITPRDLLTLLKTGDFNRYRITIPEGWTLRQIADYLGSRGLVSPEVFIARATDPVLIASLGLQVPSLEGYLFPDTYEIYKPRDEGEVIRKLVSRFQQMVTPELAARRKESPELKWTDAEVVILASIVEKETARPEERPIIASVFFNRLARGMPLASDPTVIYGIPNFSGNLTRQDLEKPGPYNTYLNPGFPPTPISNPGLASIRSVLHPAETDSLYFVSRGDGTHQFSRTEAQHLKAISLYQLHGNQSSSARSPTP